MKHRVVLMRFFLLGLASLSLVAVGCGEKKGEGNTAEGTNGDSAAASAAASATASTATSAAASSTSTSPDFAEYLHTQQELTTVIESLNSKADVDAAEPKLDELLTKGPQILKAAMENPSAANSIQNDEALKALAKRQDEHVRTLAAKDPAAGRALGQIIMKHSVAMTQGMQQASSEQVQKAMEEAKKKMGGK